MRKKLFLIFLTLLIFFVGSVSLFGEKSPGKNTVKSKGNNVVKSKDRTGPLMASSLRTIGIITNPTEGAIVYAGCTLRIRWTRDYNYREVYISYSYNNTSTVLEESTFNTGYYDWKIPDTISGNVHIYVLEFNEQDDPCDKYYRLQQASGDRSIPSIDDPCYKYYQLQQASGDRSIFLTGSGGVNIEVRPSSSRVLSPNGGETFYVGSIYPITWASTGCIANIKIEYTTNNGSTWSTIAYSVANAQPFSYTWTIPNSVSNTSKIRISDASNGRIIDESDGPFSIVYPIRVISPNGGECFTPGTTQTISWFSSPDISRVNIEYTINDYSWQSIANYVSSSTPYRWTVPNVYSTTSKVRVSNYSKTDIYDTSDTNFSIGLPPSIRVTSPNGGESLTAGQKYNVTWTSLCNPSQNVKFELLIGDTPTTAPIFIPNTGSYEWTVPDIGSSTSKIRISHDYIPNISDVSDNNFTIVGIPKFIRVISPNGGEILKAGEIHKITWVSSGITGNVKIEYKTSDQSSTWNVILSNTGSYNWQVPSTATTQGKIKVTSLNFPTVYDESDNVFTIQAIAQSITVTSPNGGEILKPGDINKITWTSSGLTGNVKIEYKTSDQSTIWTMINASVTNTGIYDWTVPSTTTAQGRVKVTSLNFPTVYDESDKVFTIQAAPFDENPERTALIELYNATNGDNWKNKTGWKNPPLAADGFTMFTAGTDPKWFGINISSGKVYTINLANNILTGAFPNSIKTFTAMKYLYLNGNNLSGTIPDKWDTVPLLLYLYLDTNKFTGPLPPTMGNLSNLLVLVLANNQLSGDIPDSFQNLKSMTNLIANRNSLSGAIPSWFGNLTALKVLNLRANTLRGLIPKSIINLINLTSTDISYNALYSNDTDVINFLNTKSPGWQNTQTIAPSSVRVKSVTSNSVTIEWNPIVYIGDPGGYEVYYGTVSGGPYNSVPIKTSNKTTTSITVPGLNPNTTYYFVVKTRSDPNSNNSNTVTSDNSNEVSAKTTL